MRRVQQHSHYEISATKQYEPFVTIFR